MNKCYFCGEDAHQFKCENISAYEYDENGKIRRIEFVTFADLIDRAEVRTNCVVMPMHETPQ